MKISNVVEIYDNDEFITIITKGSIIHLPTGNHSITIIPACDSMPEGGRDYASTTFDVNIEFYTH